MKNKNYIRHAPYLRNTIGYDHDFWYTCVKWWYLQVRFSFFWYFHFSGCQARRWGGWKGKKWPKMTKKNCLLHFISQEPYIIWSWFMVHMCKRIIFPGALARNYACCTPYLSKHISYDWFFLRKFKMMTSPDAFFIFSMFWSSGLLRLVKG